MVRSPINDEFRATGRDTMGVKFVTPKGGDAVAVVTRSVETPEVVEDSPSRTRRPRTEVTNRRIWVRMQQSKAGRRQQTSRPSPTTDLLSIQRVRADDRALCRAGTCPDAPGPPGHRADPPGRTTPAPDQRLRRAPSVEPGAEELRPRAAAASAELTAQRERGRGRAARCGASGRRARGCRAAGGERQAAAAAGHDRIRPSRRSSRPGPRAEASPSYVDGTACAARAAPGSG